MRIGNGHIGQYDVPTRKDTGAPATYDGIEAFAAPQGRRHIWSHGKGSQSSKIQKC